VSSKWCTYRVRHGVEACAVFSRQTQNSTVRGRQEKACSSHAKSDNGVSNVYKSTVADAALHHVLAASVCLSLSSAIGMRAALL
jgi:hypothetical protein